MSDPPPAPGSGEATVRLDPVSVESIARRVADLLQGEPLGSELIDAAEVARRYGISRDYVYAHASELGVIRLGDGDRARLRFDPKVIAEKLAPGLPAEPNARRSSPRRRRPKSSGGAAELLPIRGTPVDRSGKRR